MRGDEAKETKLITINTIGAVEFPGDKIKISRKGASKVTRHDSENKVHLKSIALIPQMIENSTFITEEDNVKDKTGFDTFRYYVTGINIGGEDYTAKLVVGVKNGEIYYDHALTEIEKEKLLDSIDSIKREFAGKEHPFDIENVKDKRLLSILENNSSKIVDENGEPKVVYHGTRDELEIFRPMSHFGGNIEQALDRIGFYHDQEDFGDASIQELRERESR